MNRDTSKTAEEPVTGDGDESDDRSALTRRRLVASGAATWASVSLAGCNYITDPGTEENTETPAVTTETTTTDDPGNNTTTSDGEDTPEPTPTEESTTSCASIGRFSRGMEVGLHVSVLDPETGEPLGADAIESVNIEFPNADYGPIELNWEGPHEAYDRDTWGSKIVTDEETEPGTYEYEVSVEGAEDRDIEGTVREQFTVV